MSIRNQDKPRVIQPNELFQMFGYKESQGFGTPGHEDSKMDAAKVLSWAFAVLMYLRPGDSVETNSAKFKKISSDLIHIDHNLNLKVLTDDLEKRGVIKLPV